MNYGRASILKPRAANCETTPKTVYKSTDFPGSFINILRPRTLLQLHKSVVVVVLRQRNIASRSSFFLMEGVNMMKREHKIVVAIDESEESMNALSWCLGNLASQKSNSTLVLLYVKPPPPVYSPFDAAGYMFSNDVIAAMEKYGMDMVNSVMKRAEAICGNFNNDVKVERLVGRGEAKDVICNTVEKLRADTLVMGSHGYGFLKRAFLGSVSDHCAKHVKCPVVIVKHPK